MEQQEEQVKWLEVPCGMQRQLWLYGGDPDPIALMQKQEYELGWYLRARDDLRAPVGALQACFDRWQKALNKYHHWARIWEGRIVKWKSQRIFSSEYPEYHKKGGKWYKRTALGEPFEPDIEVPESDVPEWVIWKEQDAKMVRRLQKRADKEALKEAEEALKWEAIQDAEILAPNTPGMDVEGWEPEDGMADWREHERECLRQEQGPNEEEWQEIQAYQAEQEMQNRAEAWWENKQMQPEREQDDY